MMTTVLQSGILLWLVGLALVLGWRALQLGADGPMGRGLLTSNSDGSIEPERIANLAIFPTVLIYYAFQALNADLSGPNPKLPDIPEYLTALFTGSNSIYLAGKLARTRE